MSENSTFSNDLELSLFDRFVDFGPLASEFVHSRTQSEPPLSQALKRHSNDVTSYGKKLKCDLPAKKFVKLTSNHATENNYSNPENLKENSKRTYYSEENLKRINAEIHNARLAYSEIYYSKLTNADTDEQKENSKKEALETRRQGLRFEGDLYTPKIVRSEKNKKEGFCDLCPAPGKWLQLKNSAFWYHKIFVHGVSTTGIYFDSPVQFRIIWNCLRMETEADGCMVKLAVEGLCGHCYSYVHLSNNRNKTFYDCLHYKAADILIAESSAALISQNDEEIRLLAHLNEHGQIVCPLAFSNVNTLDVFQVLKDQGRGTLWFKHAYKCHMNPRMRTISAPSFPLLK
jgi:hypothetical protein